MAYTYLDLVNKLIKRVNEVELTSSNFASATGFYSHAKDAINNALKEIDAYERFWPFNFSQGSQALVAGTMKYAFPNDTKVIDFDSFVIPQNDSLGNQTRRLIPIAYDDYKQNLVQHEYYTSTSQRDIPRYVVKSPDNYFIVVPNPDKAYTVKFDYFTKVTQLSAYDDVPTIPEEWEQVIINGAMAEVSMFRENPENAQLYSEKFLKGLRDMRIEEINQNLYVRSSANFNRPSGYVRYGGYLI